MPEVSKELTTAQSFAIFSEFLQRLYRALTTSDAADKKLHSLLQEFACSAQVQALVQDWIEQNEANYEKAVKEFLQVTEETNKQILGNNQEIFEELAKLPLLALAQLEPHEAANLVPIISALIQNTGFMALLNKAKAFIRPEQQQQFAMDVLVKTAKSDLKLQEFGGNRNIFNDITGNPQSLPESQETLISQLVAQSGFISAAVQEQEQRTAWRDHVQHQYPINELAPQRIHFEEALRTLESEMFLLAAVLDYWALKATPVFPEGYCSPWLLTNPNHQNAHMSIECNS